MTSQKIKAGGLPATVVIPASKSYANRALILGALKGNLTLENLPQASDVTLLLQALKDIGLNVHQNQNSVTFSNSFPTCESSKGVELSVGEGGTTARFLACLLIQGKAPYTLLLGDRLKDRPWQSFIELVQRSGGLAKLTGNRLQLQGPLSLPKSLEIDTSLTTQFASGMQLALAWSEVEVVPRNLNTSSSYWKMTEWLIEELKSKSSFHIPADWSSASYPLAFAALNQTIVFPGLQPDALQADSKICQVLEQMGCLKTERDSITVSKWSARRMNLAIDVHDCLDLFPTLAYLSAHIEGKHSFSGISNLVHKESDRLHEVVKLLNQFQILNEIQGDTLMIEGSSNWEIPPQKVQLPDDHRMVMTAALFLRQHQGGELAPAEAVAKSYPDFWQLFH